MKGLLSRAIESHEKLEMIYIDNEGKITQRVIRVLAVTETTVKTYCYSKRKFRTFKLENILSVGHIRKRRGA